MSQIQVHHSIRDIPQPVWDRLAPRDFPFVSYHFLAALETSGSLGKRTGWEPRFFISKVGEHVQAALIAYVRINSYGEYIFDFAWAQAYEHSGLPYYPKLTSAVPFTPATGPKLLGDPSAFPQLLEAAARDLGMSSVHHLFIPEEQIPSFEAAGYFLRHSFQYHWQNQNYANFSDFLGQLRSKRRKEVVRERAQASGVRIERLTGAQIREEHAALFYSFYLSTIDKKNSFDYLTEDFFHQVFHRMKDQMLLVLAHDEHSAVAGALNFFGEQTLFGRYWGCLAEYRALHFELCYYQGIEFAIERGFRKFEAGAQGEHKFQRGFLPALTCSAHRVHHPGLNRAIQNHVAFEKEQIKSLFTEYESRRPFR